MNHNHNIPATWILESHTALQSCIKSTTHSHLLTKSFKDQLLKQRIWKPGYNKNSKKSSNSVSCGVLNIRSAVHKAALLNQTLQKHRLDFLAVTETWIKSNAPEAIELDIAQKGFTAIDKHRGSYDDRKDGGMALIYRNYMKCIKIKVNTIENLIIKLKNTIRPSHAIIIYRPPSCSMSAFIEDFGKPIDNEIKEFINILIRGDFSVSGSQDPPEPSIDAKLQKPLEEYPFIQHISTSTHGNDHTLDLIV